MDSKHQTSESLRLPDQLPVMVLPDCYLFPGCFLPLFIFEDRYRLMLSHALQGDRMFCIGCRQSHDDNDILPYTTAGIIRACVSQADGTSHLMLYGIRRIQITGWVQEKPFRIARVGAVEYQNAEPEETEALRQQAVSMLPTPTLACSEAMQKLRDTLANIPCPDRVCDILAYHFVKKNRALRQLLQERNTTARYRLLIEELKKI